MVRNTHNKKTRPHQASYSQILRGVQTELTLPERLFSKIIHNRLIEAFTNVLSTTVFRPIPLLCGALLSCITLIVLYWLAKNNGFALSGSEWILAFLIGWSLGIIYEVIKYFFKKPANAE